MSVSDRTRAFDLALGDVPACCDVCEGPRGDLPVVIRLRPGEVIGTCSACGGATCPDGRSARRLTSEGPSDVPLITYEPGTPAAWPAQEEA